MTGRSVVIDRDGQMNALGRVPIDDEFKAIKFMEMIGREGPLREAVLKFRQTGDRKVLTQLKTENYEEIQRASNLRKMLFNE